MMSIEIEVKAIWVLLLIITKSNALFCRLIKMSSPNINNGIVFGSLLCYLSIILIGLDTRMFSKKSMEITCNVRDSLSTRKIFVVSTSLAFKRSNFHQLNWLKLLLQLLRALLSISQIFFNCIGVNRHFISFLTALVWNGQIFFFFIAFTSLAFNRVYIHLWMFIQQDLESVQNLLRCKNYGESGRYMTHVSRDFIFQVAPRLSAFYFNSLFGSILTRSWRGMSRDLKQYYN